jgi:hypothetical protein
MMKRLTMLAILLALAAGTIDANDEPKKSAMQCRDLSETTNVVGPDETLVDGKVCKVLKMTESQVGTSESPVQSKTSQVSNQRKPRIFVTESDSWAMSGGWSQSGGKGSGHMSGGARPQTAEIIKTFGKRCPDLVVNNNKERADFVVILDHEGGKGVARKRNKIAVFNRSGDSIFSDSTRSLGNSVKDSCSAIVLTSSAIRQSQPLFLLGPPTNYPLQAQLHPPSLRPPPPAPLHLRGKNSQA